MSSLIGDLSRSALVESALLLGCDYTAGVTGVGPVTCKAIFAAFPEPDRLTKFRYL